MDFWVVVAAAGAGYVAKHWQNPLISRENISDLPSRGSKCVKSKSPPLIRHIRDKRCPFRCLARINKLGEDVSKEEIACSCDFDGEKPVNIDNDEDSNVLSVSSLSPGFIGNVEDLQGDLEETRLSVDMGESSIGEMSTSYYVSDRKKSSLRTRRSNLQFIKPLSSLESCLMAQLYNKHAEMEEYVLSSVPSPSTPAVRPFLVTDGRKIISRERSCDSVKVDIGREENNLQKGKFSAGNKTVFGIPPLPNSGTLDLRRKVKSGLGKGGKSSSPGETANGKHLHSKAGSSQGALLFCLGISLGIISSFLENKREVNKLNDLLKQTENLVEDLQEELEMKDSLNVKELAIEDCESHDTHENDESRKRVDGKESHDQKEKDQSKSMSQIEAELEAELERLELNMMSSSLEQKLTDLEEVDPEFRPSIVRGELRADMFGHQGAAQPYADRDGSGPSTNHSANYAVSPRELSLRLHELVQSRLEDRVKELEIALQNSQKKVQFMESEHTKSWRESSSSEFGSSSIHGSPSSAMIINLAGEALDSYNEAYDEFLKRNNSEEEVLLPLCMKSEKREAPYPFDGNRDRTIVNGKSPETFEEHILTDASGGENESGDDEIEKLLIKHIVERTRKGSPAVLNAQRMLFPLDENLR